MDSIICPDCGKECTSDSVMCDGCGFPFTDFISCPDCRYKSTKDVTTCPNCGCPLNEPTKSSKKVIPLRLISVVLAVVIVTISVFAGVTKDKREFRDKLVAGSTWFEAETNDRISFRDNDVMMYMDFAVPNGVMGGVEYSLMVCKYKVKTGNKIVVGGETIKVSFRVDGKIMFEPELGPIAKQAAKEESEGA